MKKHLIFYLFMSFFFGQLPCLAVSTALPERCSGQPYFKFSQPWAAPKHLSSWYISSFKERPFSTLGVSLLGLGALSLGAICVYGALQGKTVNQTLKDLAFSLPLIASVEQNADLQIGQLYRDHPDYFVCALDHHTVPTLDKEIELYQLKVLKQTESGCNVRAPRNSLWIMKLCLEPLKIISCYKAMNNQSYYEAYEDSVGLQRLGGPRWLHDFDKKQIKEFSNSKILPPDTDELSKKLFNFRAFEGFAGPCIANSKKNALENRDDLHKVIQQCEKKTPEEALFLVKQVGSLSTCFLSEEQKASQSTFVQDYEKIQNLLAQDDVVVGFTLSVVYPDPETKTPKGHVVSVVIHQVKGQREYFFSDSYCTSLASQHEAAAILRNALDQLIIFIESPALYKDTLVRLLIARWAQGVLDKDQLLKAIQDLRLEDAEVYKKIYKNVL